MTRFEIFTRRDFAELSITDGITTVDFIDPQIGFHLDNWRPVESGIKGGGVWYDNPISDGRRPAFFKYENAVETFELKIGEKCTDDLYDRQIGKLRALCVAARNFFTRKWRTYVTGTPKRPVYIRARGINETNIRYCVVYTGAVPEEEDPYSPQASKALADNITFVFERGHWQDQIPEQAADLQISGMNVYKDIPVGNAHPVIPPEFDSFRNPTSESRRVLVSNKQMPHNITHVYRFDTGIGWSGNLQTGTLPHTIFRTTGTLVGDVMMFGVADDAVNFEDAIFSSLVFYLSVATDDLTLDFEYYNGVGWVALAFQQTPPILPLFSELGTWTLHWRPEEDWAQFDPGLAPGDEGWYVRLVVTGVAGSGDGAQQNEQRIYSVGWAHTHIQQREVNGDLPALIQVRLQNASDKSGIDVTPAPSLHANRVVCGLRSLARDFTPEFPDLYFSPYLDAGGLQNLGQGVTTTYYDVTTVQPSSVHWGNQIALYDPGGAAAMARQMRWEVPGPMYYGEYRVFARVFQVGGASRAARIKLIAYFGVIPIYTSEEREVISVEGDSLIDLGSCALVPDAVMGLVSESGVLETSNIFLDLYAMCASDLDLEFRDLVLIPIDEWYGDFTDTVGTELRSALGNADEDEGATLIIDSAAWQQGAIRSVLKASDGDISSVWQPVSSGPAILQVNMDEVPSDPSDFNGDTGQRLWFLFAKRYDENFDEDDWRSNHEFGAFITAKYVQRYLGSRGTR